MNEYALALLRRLGQVGTTGGGRPILDMEQPAAWAPPQLPGPAPGRPLMMPPGVGLPPPQMAQVGQMLQPPAGGVPRQFGTPVRPLLTPRQAVMQRLTAPRSVRRGASGWTTRLFR